MTEALAGSPLAPLTTLRLGGPAERLVRVSTEAELTEAVRDADAAETPLFVLAGGSNVVIADAGLAGTVLHVATRGIERRELPDGRVALTVQAGEDWDALVAGAVGNGLGGVECLSGIPGSTGATPIQNVGAYGQEVSSTIVAVRVLDRALSEVLELGREDCGFAYRTSRFKRRDRHVVLSVTFALAPAATAGSEPIRYPELARALDLEVGDRAPLREVREAVLALRRAKAMVIDPSDPDSVSAGSFFTNPILEAAELAALERRVTERLGPGASPPHWPEANGRSKTSAAWLVERAGFPRGYGEGRVGVSARHALALVNRGGGTTAELVALAREIATGVRAAFGIALQPEPVFVGHSW
jgi:UDP-N-acetylmuramate dehydrogenase